MSSPRPRPYLLPAALWLAAIALCAVQVVLVLTGAASVPLGVAAGVLFVAAAAVTAVRARRP